MIAIWFHCQCLYASDHPTFPHFNASTPTFSINSPLAPSTFNDLWVRRVFVSISCTNDERLSWLQLWSGTWMAAFLEKKADFNSCIGRWLDPERPNSNSHARTQLLWQSISSDLCNRTRWSCRIDQARCFCVGLSPACVRLLYIWSTEYASFIQ